MSSDKPLVTVCMPVYNGSSFICDAIQSVFKQSYDNLEIIVVDDCSTDDTYEKVRALQDPRLKVYRNDFTLGMPGNWNQSISYASGDLIKFLFQDDTIYPQCVSEMVKCFLSNDSVGICFSKRDIISEYGLSKLSSYPYIHDLQSALPFELKEGFHQGHTLLSQFLCSHGVSCNFFAEPSFVMIRRSFLMNTGYFSPKLRQNSDYDLWLRYLVFSNAYYISKPLGSFRIHKLSESQSGGHSFLTKVRYICEEYTIAENLLDVCTRTGDTRLISMLNSKKRRFLVDRIILYLRHICTRFFG